MNKYYTLSKTPTAESAQTPVAVKHGDIVRYENTLYKVTDSLTNYLEMLEGLKECGFSGTYDKTMLEKRIEMFGEVEITILDPDYDDIDSIDSNDIIDLKRFDNIEIDGRKYKTTSYLSEGSYVLNAVPFFQMILK